MPAYFKPLRRRIGVVMLVLACMFAAIWIRSFACIDSLTITLTASPIQTLRVSPSGFQMMREPLNPFLLKKYPYGTWYQLKPSEESKYFLIGHYKRYSDQGEPLRLGLIISHWSIVVPLTLLSAWLLLSKPRAKKPIESTLE